MSRPHSSRHHQPGAVRRPARLSRWLPSLLVLLGLTFWLLATGGVQAQTPAATAEQGLKEIEVAAGAFTRGSPPPAWADLLPLPPARPAPKAAVVVRLADSHLRVGPPHAYLVNRAEQVNDASALSEIGQPQIHFNPQFQRLLLHRVLVIRGEQTMDHTAHAKVRFLQRESGLEHGVYSGVVTAAMVLPDVRVGDTLHLVYTIEGDNPIFGSRYIGSSSWEQPHPVQWRRVTLLSPPGRDVRWRWVGDRIDGAAGPRQDEVDGLRRLRFEQRDVPVVENEPHLPPQAQPWRWLQFSEFADWNDVARWAMGLFPRDVPLPDELHDHLKRWRTLPDPAARAAAALHWVQNEIRYYSLALGESSHRPATPVEVMTRRWGDCKDKSLLLLRLLGELDIPAVPVLASLSTRGGPAMVLPSPVAFDHAIVHARIDGRDHWLDPTRLGQAGPLAMAGQALEDAWVLPVQESASALARVQSPNREAIFSSDLVERFHIPHFGEDGGLQIEQTFTGLAAEQLRMALPRMESPQIATWAVGGYDRRYPGITLDGQPVVRDEVERNRIIISARYKVPKLAAEFSGDWAMRFFPANFQGTFALPERVTRQFPVLVPSWPGTLNYRAEVQWPSSVSVVSDPSSRRLETPHFRLESSRAFRGNVATTSLKLQPLAPQVTAAELPKLLEDLRKLDQQVGGVFAVARSQIKNDGFLGIGRTTLQDNMKKRMLSQIERTTAAINGGRLSGDDLAEALCTRAESLADLERAAEGLPDAQRAVKEAPQFGRGYSCRGSVLYATGEFAAAIGDFSRALALNEDVFSHLYKRGQARFFLGQFEQAAADFARAAADKADASDRLYAQLWQAWTLQRLNRPLPADLARDAAAGAQGDWPRPALAMLAGTLTPEQVLAGIDTRMKGDQRELTLAEAWFYIGQHHLAANRPGPAREAFQRTRAQGITMYIEHVAAGFELRRMAAAKP
ncbi:MAG: DUF3857 domain-containing protein [Aquabacterium sp.]